MSYSLFVVIQFVLFFGAAFTFVIWQIMSVDRDIAIRENRKAAGRTGNDSK